MDITISLKEACTNDTCIILEINISQFLEEMPEQFYVYNKQ